MTPRQIIGAFLSAFVFLLVGCALAREPSKTPRTAIEQLLLSQAVTRSLADVALPLPAGSSVVIEVTGFGVDRTVMRENSPPEKVTLDPRFSAVLSTNSSDLGFVHDLVAGRLGELGYVLRTSGEKARYRVRVLVYGFGTEQGQSLVGLPSGQAFILPLPELSVYKRQNQEAHIRYSIDIFDVTNGRLVRSTPWYRGTAYYDLHTFLMFLVFARTDLVYLP